MSDSGGVLDHHDHQLISMRSRCGCVASLAAFISVCRWFVSSHLDRFEFRYTDVCVGVCSQKCGYMYGSHLYDNGKSAECIYCVWEK